MRKTVGKRSVKLLLIIMVMWLLGSGQAVMGAEEAVCETTIDRAVLQDTGGAALPEAPVVSMYSARSSTGWSYGNQLTSANELAIYQTLAAVEDMTEYHYFTELDSNGEQVVVSSKGITVTLPDPCVCEGTESTYKNSTAYAELQKVYNKASHAYIKDYGMEYWIYYFGVVTVRTDNGNGTVTVNKLVFYPIDYYSEIRSEFGITEEALNEAIQKIANESSRYRKVKAAHDYVAELVEYNNNDLLAAYGHTITGGLLDKYNHLGVCECYAKLFRLLCVENGIPCILVTGGKSRDSNGDIIANHMWNYVQMGDGQWYLVDTTWDDQNSVDYTYFLVGSTSQGLGALVSEDHLPVGCFSDSILYDPFIMPTLATEAYEAEVPITEIILGETELEVHIGGTANVTVSGYLPENANVGTNMMYVSADPGVATVSAIGKITAKKAGNTRITVSSTECASVQAVCEVTVTDHTYDNGVVSKAATCTAEGIKTYTCTVNGCGQTETENIPATGHKAGDWLVTTPATGTATGKKVQQCTAEGCGQVLNEASIAKTFVELNVSGTIPLRKKKSTNAIKIASYTAGDSVDKWTSSNSNIAKVNSKTGKITASKKKTGTAVITVTMKSGATDSVKIKVQSKKVATKKLTVQSELKAAKYKLRLKVKETYMIAAAKSPITSENSIKYSTSKKKVATVNSKGKITAKKAGNATITVKSGSKKVKIKVTVTK